MGKLPLIADRSERNVGSSAEAQSRRCWRYGDNWRYYRGGACRDVTFRERRSDEVVVRHVRRCG
jgi:hypothetical protein